MQNSSQMIKLFDRKFVANTLRNTRCCPRCRSEFSYNYDLRMGDNHVKSNRPFLLSCGHNMCENCVYQNRQALTCTVCQRPIEVSLNHHQFLSFHVRNFFDLNFFLLGELHHVRFYKRDCSGNNTLRAMPSSNPNSPKGPQAQAAAVVTLKCSECELEPAVGLCRQCNVYYCKVCYDSIHMYGKALKRHTLQPLHQGRGDGALRGMPKPSQCRRHNRMKDRYCRKCDLVCCSLCAKADHNNHGWTTLLAENERIKDEIGVVLEAMKMSRENLRKAQKVEGMILGLLESVLIAPPSSFTIIAINVAVMTATIIISSKMKYDITKDVICLSIWAFFMYIGFALLLLFHVIFNVKIVIVFYCSLIVALVLVDVKAVEMQLEDYAAQCLKDISDYFLLLHGFLQNEERRIVDDFNGRCATPQQKIRETFSQLCESQNILNRMRSELEFYQHKVPCDIHMRHVICGYNNQLEQLHCQVQISKLDTNPFTFEVQRDMRKDFAKYYRYDYTDPNISLRIGPMYGDLNRSFHDTKSQLSMDLDSTDNHKQRIDEKNQRRKQALCHNRCTTGATNSTSDSDCAQKHTENSLARICHVKSPENFYIQMESSLREIRELTNKFVDFVHPDLVPKTITEGRCYMAYHSDDKLWYRAMVKKILPKDTYKVFLVDLGIKLDVPKKRLCELDSKSLSIPYAAIRCAIHDIMPAGNAGWTEEANNLLIEVTRNQSVRVSIVERIKDNILKVDLFTTHTTESFSVRDSFLYTGLARERSGLSSLQPQSKKLSPVARINQRLHKYSFQSGDMMMVKVTHIENPQLFYVIKMDQIEAKQKMRNDLNFMYGQQESQPQPIFLASLQMCCAVHINDIWHRGCVEDIRPGGKICVRLVDEGTQELVDWRQICILSADFKQQKEFAIKCALADVEPLQTNNYAWTNAANREFRQMVANPTLQLAVFSARQNEYKVTLHVCKKHVDINIGAVLAKDGHCLSTGEASQIVEVFKTPKRRLNLAAVAAGSPPSHESVAGSGKQAAATKAKDVGNRNANAEVKVLKRTPIKVVHIVDPGEFYIQIANLVPGIMKFHNQIQEAQRQLNSTASSNTLSSQEHREWFVGDHCLVLTGFENSISLSAAASKRFLPCQHVLEQCEWYRAIIISYAPERNAERPYALFLRDVGVTVSDIGRSQLSAIDQQWDRVTNAVHRCHLACVEPTGGVAEWTHSAIDCFKHTVSSFQVLSATLHNKRSTGSNSLPIVLWGTITETADPLAPCISKYSNVNRILVKAGLAHSVQRLDITEQLDKLVELELAEGEITLEEWYKNFSSNAALKEVERTLQQRLDKDNDQDMCVQYDLPEDRPSPHLPYEFGDDLLLNEADNKPTIYTEEAPPAWRRSKGIEKSIFAGIPTYVDFDCVVYLHDAADDDLLDRMRAKILNVYNFEHTPAMLAVEYKPGQACIVRYHVDKKFYRGIVQKRDTEGQYTVQFVDYGNVESVEPANLRPYAPFPKLPSIACKYRIAGIRPKHGAKVYPTLALDYIHGMIVDKLVSVRVPPLELSRTVKMCSIRVGTTDLAELLISEDYAEKVQILPTKSAAGEASQRRNAFLSCNRLPPVTEFDVDRCLPIDKEVEVNITKEFQFKRSAKKSTRIEAPTDPETSDAESGVDDDDDYAVNACLDQLLHKLDNQDINLDSDSSDEPVTVAPPQDHHQQTFMPPRKKRMFDPHEYKQMHAQMEYETLYGSEHFMKNEQEDMMCEGASAESNALGGAFGIVDDDDDGDIVELEQSFARNYWHAIDEAEEEKKDNDVPLKRPISAPQRQDLESSGFDKFHPNETSSVFSHFSGIETFKQPQLPAGVRSFSCSVVSIITPTMLQIVPHLTEFEYRDLELQRRIKHLVKSAPALTQFEPRTVCLSCYNKDKKWYRALIRSYNPVAKQADVLYVDYWNSESVPIKQLRQCPMELIGWPLRTFKVRLHGLAPNPRMREKDLCQSLQNVILKRTLVARVKKEAPRAATNVIDSIDCTSNDAGTADSTLMEIDLCDSNESAVPVYESLVQDNFYSRI